MTSGMWNGTPVPDSGVPVDVPSEALLEDEPYEPVWKADTEPTHNGKGGCQGCEHRMAQMEALVTHLREQQEAMVSAFNIIGKQQQEMWDGIGNLMRFFNSIAADLNTMSLGDKIKLASQLAKGGTV